MVLSESELQLAEKESYLNSRLISLLKFRQHTKCFIVQCLADREIQRFLGKNKNCHLHDYNNGIAHLEDWEWDELGPLQVSCSLSSTSQPENEKKTLKELRKKVRQYEKLVADEKKATAAAEDKSKRLELAMNILAKLYKTETGLLQSNINRLLDEVSSKDVHIEQLLKSNDGLRREIKQQDAKVVKPNKPTKEQRENEEISKLTRKCEHLGKLVADRNRSYEALQQKHKNLRDSFERYKSTHRVKVLVPAAGIQETESKKTCKHEELISDQKETIALLTAENSRLQIELSKLEIAYKTETNLFQSSIDCLLGEIDSKDKEIVELLESNDDLQKKVKLLDVEIDKLLRTNTPANENRRIAQLSRKCEHLEKLVVDRNRFNDELLQKNKDLQDSFERYRRLNEPNRLRKVIADQNKSNEVLHQKNRSLRNSIKRKQKYTLHKLRC